jgi:hypothetical protein
MSTVVVNRKYETYDVYIGRPTKWGNPFKITNQCSRKEAVEMYRLWLEGKLDAPDGSIPPTREEIIKELTGKRIGCSCAPLACHGDVLVEVTNYGRLWAAMK